jgi:alpha-N-arabinofuranosidase
VELGSFSDREKVDDIVPFGFGTKYDWTGALLAHSVDYIDYLGEHFYGYSNLVIDPDKQAFVEATDPLEHRARRMPNKVQFKFEAWEEYLKRMPYLKDKNIKFAFDEWAPRNARANQSTAVPPNNPMLNTLTNALVYHGFFRHSDMVALAVATGGMMTLANDSHGDAVGYRLDGLLIKLFHDRFTGRLPVAVTGNSPQHTIKGTVAVYLSAHPSGSPTYPLDIFAALGADKKTITISVVNPTETTQDCDLALMGVRPVGDVKLWQLAAPPGKPSAPTGFGPGAFGDPPAAMAERSVAKAPGRVTVPPASISVYEFSVK